MMVAFDLEGDRQMAVGYDVFRFLVSQQRG
jgi:hypothetical protein